MTVLLWFEEAEMLSVELAERIVELTEKDAPQVAGEEHGPLTRIFPMRHSHNFPPSSAERWLACRRSVSFIKSLPTSPRVASRYAAEGTLAHLVADAYLTGKTPDPVGKVVSVDGHDIEITEDMHKYAGLWRDIVKARGGVCSSEHEVDLSSVVGKAAGMFGNLDATVLVDRKLSVFDYKYGRGIEVYPQDNAQLLCYAAGAYYDLTPKEREDVDEIELVIVQPRTPNGDFERSWIISDLDLMRWTDQVLKPAVSAIAGGHEDMSPFVTGEHCRFCPATAHCPGLKARAQQLAVKQFSLQPTEFAGALSDDELGEQMLENNLIQLRIDAVAAEALKRAQAGARIKHHKLVAKRAVRKWKDPLDAAIWLREHGSEEPDWYTRPELKSPAQMEKFLVPQVVAMMNKSIVSKESSGTSLVQATDPRPEVVVKEASEIFSDVPVDAKILNGIQSLL